MKKRRKKRFCGTPGIALSRLTSVKTKPDQKMKINFLYPRPREAGGPNPPCKVGAGCAVLKHTPAPGCGL